MKVQLKDGIASRDGIRGWLKADKEYVVLAVEYQAQKVSYRIAAENGTPALFEAEFFATVDPTVDPHWVLRHPEGSQSELVPLEWTRIGFWEEFFDDDPEAKVAYETVLERMTTGW